MHKRKLSCFAIQLLIGCLLGVPNILAAQHFYKDKIIRFIVGQAAGGGYDTYTRTVARHMIKHIPGHPAITVENMTGAGSLVAANYIITTPNPMA
jgi:tripartite-type tricarboxylate transporter receptor subunit TctC